MPKRKRTVKDGATFFRSYYEAVEHLPEDAQKEWFHAIIMFLFRGQKCSFSVPNKFLDGYWKLIEPILKTSISRSSSGHKGGKQNGSKTEANGKQNGSNDLLENKNKNKNSNTSSLRSEALLKEKDAIASPKKAPKPDMDADSILPFDDFWDLYDKKEDKQESKKLYGKLSEDIRARIKQAVPVYVKAQPEKRFRKSPARWLRNQCWEDEPSVKSKEEEIDEICRSMDPDEAKAFRHVMSH